MKLKKIIWIIALVLLVGTAVAQYTEDNIIWYDFYNAEDEASALLDHSPEGNNATNNDALFIANSFSFDGNDFLNATQFDPRNLTICTWINTTNSLSSVHGLVSEYNGGDGYRSFTHEIYDAKIRLVIYSTGSAFKYCNGNTNINTGNKVQMCMTWNGTILQPFLDGSPAACDTSGGSASGDIFKTNLPFRIGMSSDGTARYFIGQIYNVMIWNKSKSKSFINDLYNEGVGYNPYVDYITLSNYNITSNNTVAGESTTTWNDNGMVNITSNLLSGTFTVSEASNCSISLTDYGGYRQTISNNSNYTLATTETTSQAFTLYDNLIVGNQSAYIYCTNVGETMNGSSGALKINYIASSVTSQLCSRMSELTFTPDIDYYNITTGRLTQYNVSPDNNSLCGYTYNLTYPEAGLTDIEGRLNETNSQYAVLVNGVNLTLNSKTILNGTVNGTVYFVNVTLSYINANSSWNGWAINWSVV